MRTCRVCKSRYEPIRQMQTTCDNFDCMVAYAEKAAKRAADKRKAGERKKVAEDKRKTRQRLDTLKSRQDRLKEAQAVINAYVRWRDRNDPCISCGRPASWQGQWHASHFRSVGAASAVRFNLWNIHKACSICNHHLSGNIAGYEPRLVEKIGKEKVDWLKSQNKTVRHDAEYLARLKRVFAKLKRTRERK